MDEHGITFRWKDYRAKGKTRYKTMTLEAHEFMRRFLLHVLPGGFHRIRHYGLLANAGRRRNLARVRALLLCEAHEADGAPQDAAAPVTPVQPPFVCRCCGAVMHIIETFLRRQPIRATATTESSMTQGIASTPSCTSVPCSPSRIAKGIALRCNEADSCCAGPQRIRHTMPSPGIGRTSLYEVPVSSRRSTRLYANKPHNHRCCANCTGPFRGFLPCITRFQ
jgi:hypothetical protein